MRAPSIAALLLGLVLLGVTGWRVWQTNDFLSRSVRTTGTIVDAAAHPLIAFRSESGVRETFTQNGFVSGLAGASVPVAYEASDPAGTARVVSFWPLWGVTLWLLPAGLGFTILPLLGEAFGLRGR